MAISRAALGSAFLLLSLAGSSFAQDAAPEAPTLADDGGWKVSVAPYLWGAGLDGTVAANGVQTDFDVEFSDIFDELDFGFLNAIEIRNERVIITANLIYLKLSPESNRAIGSVLPGAPPGDFSVDAESQTLIVEIAPGYELVSSDRVAIDVRAGLRYWWLENELDVRLDPGSPLGPFRREFESTIDWLDVMVGARMRARLTPKVGLVVAGDVGGFELGSASELSWSAQGFVTYALGEHWELGAGWRSLDVDRGAVNVRMEGPLIGAMRRF
jgi:hypothetical protein